MGACRRDSGHAVSRSPYLDFYPSPPERMIINPYAFPTGGGGFVPTDIAGCQLWLHADSLSLSDGDPVATWTDSSGQGNNATQGTSGTRPTFKTNILNGLPVVRFDGSKRLDGSVSISGDTMTAFVVAQLGSGGSVVGRMLSLGASGAESPSNNISRFFDNALYQRGAANSLAGITQGVWFLAGVVCNGSTFTFFKDGSGNSPESSTGNFGVTQYAVGNQIAVTNVGTDGDIAEIIIYDTALSTGNREAVEDYLGQKYSITIA